MRVLIVDDEPAARRKTRRFLDEHGGIEVAGEAQNGNEAVEKILALRPDVVFLDIQMPDIDGFDVVEAVAGSAHVPRFVFVTAHDRYAVRAFEVNAMDYLLKPFDRERFSATLQKCNQSERGASQSQLISLLDSLRPPGRYMRRLLFSRGGRSAFIPVSEVLRFQSDRNNVTIHARTGPASIRTTLDALEARLDPEQFARVHRSHIVNLDAVRQIDPWFHGDYKITLDDGTEIAWSRRFAARRPDLLRA